MTTLPTKNWTLRDIFDSPARCHFCGTPIRWNYVLGHADLPGDYVAGSECVKALTDACNPDTAFALMQGGWRQRRTYFYKQTHHLTYSIGPRNGQWWASVSRGVRGGRVFAPQTFTTEHEAKLWLAQHEDTLRAQLVALDMHAGEE